MIRVWGGGWNCMRGWMGCEAWGGEEGVCMEMAGESGGLGSEVRASWD